MKAFYLLLLSSLMAVCLGSGVGPTRLPTVRPTQAEIYIMSVEQNIVGISETQFKADLTANSNAFAACVVNALDSIEASDVAIKSVKTGPTSSARSIALRRLTDSVHVTYEVTYNIATLGYTGNPDGAYNHFLDELKTAVKDSDFNTYLTNNAGTYGAPDLASATTTSIESSYYTDSQGKVQEMPNHKKRQTRYFEIGVIAGGGGFLILVWLVVGALYYCSKRYDDGPKQEGAAAVTKDGFEAVKTKEVELTPSDGATSHAVADKV